VFALMEKAGGEPRELEKIGPQSFLAYRPKGEAIAVFKTTDGGASWSREPNDVHVGQRVDRVFAIDSAHPDAKLLIIEGGDQTLERGTRDVFIGRVTAQQASESPAAPPRVTSPG
jgi:hypothetical protein